MLLQDPTELDKFNLAEFYHLKKGLKVNVEGIQIRNMQFNSRINLNQSSSLLFTRLSGELVWYFVEEEQAKKDPKYRLKAINAETRDILNELDTTYKPEVLPTYTRVQATITVSVTVTASVSYY